MEEVSVIIPTHNSWKTLRSCIESLLKQTLKSAEIIVVDNASDDNTQEGMKKLLTINHYPSTIKYFRNEKNLGVTGGRNKGIELANKNLDFLLFFDHDMVADKKMLEELIKVAEMDDKIGIVTPKIYYWEDKERIWAAGTGINLWTGQVIFRGGKDIGQHERVEEVQVAPACLLVKREVIDQIGGFDQRYFATFEDTDFCFRAKKVGFKTFYAPKAIAYHKISSNPKDEAERLLSRAYWVGRNRVLFMKDFGKPTFWFFLPFFALYYLRMSSRERNFSAFWSYLKGLRDGILE